MTPDPSPGDRPVPPPIAPETAETSEGAAAIVEATTPRLPRPTLPGAMGWCFALALYSGLILVPCYLLVDLLLEGCPQPAVFLIAATVSTFVVASLVTMKALGQDAGQALALRRLSLPHVALIVLLAPAQAIVAAEVGNWAAEVFPVSDRPATSFSPRAGFLPDFAKMEEEFARQSWWLILVVGCLLPALGEEAFFRGFLGRGFVARGGLAAGVLLTSLVFGVMHVHPHQACVTAALGIGLHLAFLTARSFWAPVLLHGLHNTLVFGAMRLAQEGGIDLTGQYSAGHLPVGTVLAAAVATALLWYLLYATRTRWVQEDGREWSPGYATAEMPPVGVTATASTTLPGPVPLIAAGGAFLVFVGVTMVQANPVGAVAAWHWIEQGNARLAKGEVEEAITDYTRAIRLDPANAIGHFNRGLALLRKDRFAEAIPDFDEAIRSAPDMVDAYLNRGFARSRLDAHAEAIADYTEVIRLDPGQVTARANRGLAYMATGDQDRAIADLTEAVRRDSSAQHHVWRGHAYLRKEQFDLANRDFSEAIRLEPGMAEAHYLRGMAFEAVGNKARADADFQEAFRLDPKLAAREP